MDYAQVQDKYRALRYFSSIVDYVGWATSTSHVFTNSLFNSMVMMIPGVLGGPFINRYSLRRAFGDPLVDESLESKRLNEYFFRQAGRNGATAVLAVSVKELLEKPSLEVGLLTVASTGLAIAFHMARTRSRRDLIDILEE